LAGRTEGNRRGVGNSWTEGAPSSSGEEGIDSGGSNWTVVDADLPSDLLQTLAFHPYSGNVHAQVEVSGRQRRLLMRKERTESESENYKGRKAEA
jgi:hypothetical protein